MDKPKYLKDWWMSKILQQREYFRVFVQPVAAAKGAEDGRLWARSKATEVIRGLASAVEDSQWSLALSIDIVKLIVNLLFKNQYYESGEKISQ